MDTPKPMLLIVLSLIYGLIFNLSIFHPDVIDQPKIKILIQSFMNEGDGKIRGGAFSLHLSFPRRCPGFALALIDNVFLQQYNPPFCFHFYSCKMCWILESLSSRYCKKWLLFNKLRIFFIWQIFPFFFCPKTCCAICQHESMCFLGSAVPDCTATLFMLILISQIGRSFFWDSCW